MVFRWVLCAAVLSALLASTSCQWIAGLDDKTADVCAGLPSDALAAGASEFSGTCLTDTSAAPDVKVLAIGSGDPPTAAGGTIEDGTYVLVAATIYGNQSTSSGYAGPQREVLHVTGNQIFYVFQNGKDEPMSWWAVMRPSGVAWSPDPASYFDGYRCPPVACRGDVLTPPPVGDENGGNLRPTYTATPNELLFIYPPYNFSVSIENAAVLTFVRQL
jgi:hypothetical protein